MNINVWGWVGIGMLVILVLVGGCAACGYVIGKTHYCYELTLTNGTTIHIDHFYSKRHTDSIVFVRPRNSFDYTPYMAHEIKGIRKTHNWATCPQRGKRYE